MAKTTKKFISLFVILLLGLVLVLNLTFPMFYKEEVELYADIFSVDKYLIYSIMKAESNFDKDATSNKGAKGLMQLLDSTSEEIFDDLNVSRDYRNLYLPESNIMAGTYYISRLLDKYDGNLQKAIAAYNSGMSNVESWENGHKNTFKENIEFKETSNYLNKVEVYHFAYKFLYEKMNLSFVLLPDFFVSIKLALINFLRSFRRMI